MPIIKKGRAAEGADGLNPSQRAAEQISAWDRLQDNIAAEQEANQKAFDDNISDKINKAAEAAEPAEKPKVLEGFICCY